MVPLSLILIGSWLGFQGRDIFGERLDRQRHISAADMFRDVVNLVIE